MGKSIEDRKMAAFEDILEELKEIAEEARCICKAFRELLRLLFEPRALQISQIIGGNSMAIVGIVVGATGTFQESPSAPPGAVEPAGTTRVWSSDDATNTSLTPSADGTTVAVAVAATAPSGPGAGFNLSVKDTYPDGNSASGTAFVPFLPVPAPEPTALAVNQLS
jgi:hypothetical protein